MIFFGAGLSSPFFMNLAEFKQLQTPESTWDACLLSLWYDYQGNWDEAHSLVDHLQDLESARVHAYLHRKEGDNWNANYWYRKANQIMPKATLDEEWEHLAEYFLSKRS